MVVNLKIQVQHLVKIESVHAGDRHAQGITDEVPGVMVFENRRTLGEDGAFVWLFDIVLERHQAIFPGFVQQFVHHLQGIDVGLLGVFGTTKDATDSCGDLLKDMKWIGNENGANGGSADGKEFGRLNQHAEVAVLHQIAAHHTAENHDNANNRKHGSLARLNASTADRPPRHGGRPGRRVFLWARLRLAATTIRRYRLRQPPRSRSESPPTIPLPTTRWWRWWSSSRFVR